jgi:hypothetical protein
MFLTHIGAEGTFILFLKRFSSFRPTSSSESAETRPHALYRGEIVKRVSEKELSETGHLALRAGSWGQNNMRAIGRRERLFVQDSVPGALWAVFDCKRDGGHVQTDKVQEPGECKARQVTRR